MGAGVEAVKAVKEVLSTERTLAQSAILFALAAKPVATVLPNFTSSSQIKEFIESVEKPPLSLSELSGLRSLWKEVLADKLKQPFADSTSKPTPKRPTA